MQLERRTQLSVYLENRVGALAQLCELIAAREINLLGICAIDTVEEAVLRIVPEDAASAAQSLDDHGFRAIETPVLVLELPNRPGATGQVASQLAQGGVNIDYLYASAHPGEGRTILVIRTHEIDAAERILSKE